MLVQLLACTEYIDPDSHNIHSVTGSKADGRTDGQTDDTTE